MKNKSAQRWLISTKAADSTKFLILLYLGVVKIPLKIAGSKLWSGSAPIKVLLHLISPKKNLIRIHRQLIKFSATCMHCPIPHQWKLIQEIPRSGSRFGLLPKFNSEFPAQRYMSGNIFTKIQSAVFMQSFRQRQINKVKT